MIGPSNGSLERLGQNFSVYGRNKPYFGKSWRIEEDGIAQKYPLGQRLSRTGLVATTFII
jgi:hypothetical protein